MSVDRPELRFADPPALLTRFPGPQDLSKGSAADPSVYSWV